MKVSVKPIDLLPNEKSSADEWVSFYQSLKARYGKEAAMYAFIKRWSLRRGDANVNDIEKGTDLELSKSFLEGVQKVGISSVNYVGGFINTIGTGGKVIFYSSIGLGIILVGGIIYRLITLSAEDAGKVAGTAAKIYTGKP